MTAVPSPAGLRGAGRAEQLDETLAQLWPGHRRSDAPAGREGGPTAGSRESYVLLPRRSRPTLMVPRRPRANAAAALRSFKASGDRRTQALLTLLGRAAWAGALDLLPSRLDLVPGPEPARSIRDHLRAILDDPGLSVALQTSPPRANRKPVLQVISSAGRTTAYVKVGVNDLTRHLVVAEGEALDRLNRARLTRLRVPSLLHRGRWRGMELLVQSALPRGDGRSPPGNALVGAMLEVASIPGAGPEPAFAQYRDRLRARVGELPRSPSADSLTRALSELGESGALTEPLQVGHWHGDWTPWNMSFAAGAAQVWDWERFEGGVPLGFDRVHFDIQGAVVRRGRAPDLAVRDTLADAPGLLAPFGVSADEAAVTALLYLVEIGTRYLHDGQEQAGSSRGNLQTWLAPELLRGIGELRARRGR